MPDPVGSTFWSAEITRLETALAAIPVGVVDTMDANGNRITMERRRAILEQLTYCRDQYDVAAARESGRSAIVLARRATE